VPNDTNNSDDVFLRDRTTQTTTRVSVATGGGQASSGSQAPRISADGRYVLFESGATDLVAGDTNVTGDVFLRDVVAGTTERVSISNTGLQATGPSYAPAVSANGRFVAFHSAANNLVTGDTNNAWDVFLRDRQLGTTTRVSVSSTGTQALSNSSNASISADGRFIAFHSGATNLVTGDTNGSWDVFVRDTQTGTTTRVSRATSGVQSNGSSVNASISADGRYVAFHSAATNLVPADINAFEDVFVHDRTTAMTTRVSVALNGLDANNISRYAQISGNGRYVAFESLADNLLSSDGNVEWDIMVRDMVSGTTTRASVGPNDEEGDGRSVNAAISDNGQFVAFDSYSTTFGSDTNNTKDVYVRDSAYPAPYTYCTAGTTSHGCVPVMGYSGTPSATASSGFTLKVTAVEGQKQGILFYGINNSGFSPLPWGPSTSFMCVKSPTQRTLAQSSGGSFNACDGSLTLDWNAFMAATPTALGSPRQPGLTVYAQGWFRDPPSPKTTMLSDAAAFVVGP
jgi:Tol biopolymer transport system component